MKKRRTTLTCEPPLLIGRLFYLAFTSDQMQSIIELLTVISEVSTCLPLLEDVPACPSSSAKYSIIAFSYTESTRIHVERTWIKFEDGFFVQSCHLQTQGTRIWRWRYTFYSNLYVRWIVQIQ